MLVHAALVQGRHQGRRSLFYLGFQLVPVWDGLCLQKPALVDIGAKTKPFERISMAVVHQTSPGIKPTVITIATANAVLHRKVAVAGDLHVPVLE